MLFKVYSFLDIFLVYVIDDVVLEEGEFEVDILKGLYLDKGWEVSVRMWFSFMDIRISFVVLNFVDENRNFFVRLCYGKWESEVSLILVC